MDEFTVYCTPEQIRKALELGVPIRLESEYYHPTEHDLKLDTPIPCKLFTTGYHYAKCPTAEQMIGWLRSKDIQFHFDDETNYWAIRDATDDLTPLRWYGYSSNKELDAIAAALEYLANKNDLI